MSVDEVIDTFPAFLTYWLNVRGRPLDEQIERWAAEYMAPWPELLAMQVEDYASQDLDWRRIAREKVFPYLSERLPTMQDAYDNLLRLLAPVYSKAEQMLRFDSSVVFVLYVGIGCGAGWVTPYRSAPAILFGLESIAECRWSDSEMVAGLIAHEIGHLAHQHWRAQHRKPIGTGPWWQLYEEGFAEQCESLVLQSEIWRRASQQGGDDWLDWCQSHQAWLATEFLRTVDAGKPVTPFFGSWFDICGRSQTGYYLGYEVIQELQKRHSVKKIALLDSIEEYARPILEQMAGYDK
ncbi:MAG: hypothetical protein M8467_12070 [Anaerolineae bacterium]|nr:hypothetical protein [Anaerolineae bacterium]